MCVILAALEGGEIKADDIEKAVATNADGSGLAWPTEEGKIRWVKGLDDQEAIHILEKEVGDIRPVVFHARLATAGGESPHLTHPFPLTRRVGLELTGVANGVFFHNGHLSAWTNMMEYFKLMGISLPGTLWSDTRLMAWLAYRYGMKLNEPLWKKAGLVTVLRQGEDGKPEIKFNDAFEEYRDNTYASNMYWDWDDASSAGWWGHGEYMSGGIVVPRTCPSGVGRSSVRTIPAQHYAITEEGRIDQLKTLTRGTQEKLPSDAELHEMCTCGHKRMFHVFARESCTVCSTCGCCKYEKQKFRPTGGTLISVDYEGTRDNAALAGPCSVDDTYCLAPKNVAPPLPVERICYACDGAVCKNCSLSIDTQISLEDGSEVEATVYMCHGCVEHYEGDDERVLLHLSKIEESRAREDARNPWLYVYKNVGMTLVEIFEELDYTVGLYRGMKVDDHWLGVVCAKKFDGTETVVLKGCPVIEAWTYLRESYDIEPHNLTEHFAYLLEEDDDDSDDAEEKS